ncbi:MAG: 4-hydroxybenzoate octaprenyltransferase [Geminicoccaceae bacterium]
MPGQGNELHAAVTDRQTSWIERLPDRWRDYATLARWDRPIGTWLLLLPCWWGQALAGPLPSPWLMLLFAIGAIAMRGAGCTVNDLTDRDFDRKVARTRNRPLASGRLGVREALLFIVAQSLVGLLVLLGLNWPAALVAIASIPLIVVYPFMKRITYWPQAFLGLTFNWGALVGYAAVTGRLDAAALLLYAAGFFWTLGYDTLYAHQDKEDDALIGVKSTALLLGNATPRWLLGFYGLMLLLLVAAGVSAGKGWLFYAALLPVTWLLLRQARELRLDQPADCLGRFRANRDVGLAVFGALVLGSLG